MTTENTEIVPKELTEQEVYAAISDFLETAYKAVEGAKSLADKYNASFNLDIGGYGMGGWYDGEDSSWEASSQSC
jgi:hypothetical protein